MGVTSRFANIFVLFIVVLLSRLIIHAISFDILTMFCGVLKASLNGE